LPIRLRISNEQPWQLKTPSKPWRQAETARYASRS